MNCVRSRLLTAGAIVTLCFTGCSSVSSSESDGGSGSGSGKTGGTSAATGGGSGGTSASSGGMNGSGGSATGHGGSSAGFGGISGSAGSTTGSGGTSASSGGMNGSGGSGGRAVGAGGGGTSGGTGESSGGSDGSGGSSGAGGGAGSNGTAGAGPGAGGMDGSAGASGGSTDASTCTAGSTKVGDTCQSGWSAVMGKYILNNNWWGTAGATGQQCVWGTCQDGDVVGWVTNWNWSGGMSSVLTYTSIVFGWQYGFQVPNTGLPIQVSSGKAINCGWDFALSQTSGGYDVAYDIWMHTTANPPSTGGQSDDVMIWLNEVAAVPAGSIYASGISIAGATWTLWEGNVGWPVHSYVRSGNTSSASLNVMVFMDDLAMRGRMPNTRYVSGVQAGIEVRSGSGTLTTNGFYCRIE